MLYKKHIKHVFACLLLLSLAIGCGAKISSKPKAVINAESVESTLLKKIKSRDTLKVGTTADFMPFSYHIDTTNKYHGIDIEMAHDLAKFLDVEIEFIETTWPTLMTDLQEDKFDIGMSGITITSTRQKQAFFSQPMYSSGKAAITRDENVNQYTNIDSINKKEVRVIFNPGGTNEAFARANFPKATLILNENNLSIFQKIVDKQADVMVTDAIETMIQERVHTELEAVNPEKPFNSFDFGYLFKKDSIFKNQVNDWLIVQKKDSIVMKLLKKELEKLN